MLVACRLAGLSGLEAHYADVDGYGQMRITSWLSAAQASYSDVFLELIKIEGRRNRRAAIWANKLANNAQDRRELQRGHLSAKVTLGHFHHIRACFIEAAARFASR